MRAVSVITPLSCLLYPLLIGGVAYILHDNPPNANVVSYYYTTGARVGAPLTVGSCCHTSPCLAVGLLFGFAVSSTYYFLFQQQSEMYACIYDEASSLNTLLEECACGAC